LDRTVSFSLEIRALGGIELVVDVFLGLVACVAQQAEQVDHSIFVGRFARQAFEDEMHEYAVAELVVFAGKLAAAAAGQERDPSLRLVERRGAETAGAVDGAIAAEFDLVAAGVDDQEFE